MSEIDDDREGGYPPHGVEVSDDGDSDLDSGDPDTDDPLFGEADPVPEPVEPGSPTLENAVFVALGVASMIALVVHLLSLL